jgi:hypothetical protein
MRLLYWEEVLPRDAVRVEAVGGDHGRVGAAKSSLVRIRVTTPTPLQTEHDLRRRSRHDEQR